MKPEDKKEYREIPSAAFHTLDERDYYIGSEFGVDIPDIKINDDELIQDQDKAGYPYGCVHFAASMNDNFSNWRDGKFERSTGKELADASPTFIPTIGDYISAGPLVLKKKGYIEGYFVVRTLQDTLQQIAKGNIIHVGSNTINWRDTLLNTFVAVIGKGSGHSFQIIGYNNTHKEINHWKVVCPPYSLICKNSYDNRPYFYIRFADFDRAMYPTKYYFENDKDPIIKYKQNIMKDIKLDRAKKAFLAGLWNGRDDGETITRGEAAAIIYSSLEKAKDPDFDLQKVEEEFNELMK